MNLILQHVKNPDICGGYWQAPISPKHQTVAVETLKEARSIFETWRDENDFGAGNMSRKCGQVWDGARLIGRFSYNGRFWDVSDNEIAI